MKTSAKTAWLIIAAVVVIGLIWWGASRNNAQGGTIKIGAILPLTGDSAELGEAARNSLQLALADLKGTKHTYQLVIEDDGNFDSSLAASAMTKLSSVDRVAAVISLSSGTGNVVAPIATQNKMIHFACASDPAIAQGEYNFVDFTPPSEEVKLLVSELQKKGYERIGLFDMNQQGTIAEVNDFKNQIKGTNIRIVTEQNFNFTNTDFRSMILKAEAAKPDIYVLNLFSPGLESLAKQLKELGVKTPITSIESFDYTDQKNLFEGAWYIQAADAAPWFASEYAAKYGKDYKLCSANVYDAFNLIVHAYESAGQNPDGTQNADKAVAQIMSVQNYDGALGTISVGANHIINSKAIVKTIKNGQAMTVAP